MSHKNRYHQKRNQQHGVNSQQPATSSNSFENGWFLNGHQQIGYQQRFPLAPPPGFAPRYNGPLFQPQTHQQFPMPNGAYRPGGSKNYSHKRSISMTESNQQAASSRAPELRRQGQPQRANNDITSPAAKRFLQKQTSVESQHSPIRQPNLAQRPPNQQNQQRPQKKQGQAPTQAQLAQMQKEKEWSELFHKALTFLERASPGDEVNTLLQHLQPTRASWNQLKIEIDNAMQRLMAPLGVAKVLVFGSTLTGLDFMGSDFDYHVELNTPPTSKEETVEALQKIVKFTRYNGYSGDFRLIYSIMYARVPIVRLLHIRSRTVCDLNLTSKFGYYNSCFIGNILRYDPRIKGLAVILKLWSKQYKISERMIVSNYCLVMLAIFYLQNLEQPMLSSVKANQDGRELKILDTKYRWNVYFNDSMNLSKNNNQTLRQLLVGFFEFYDKMNFPNYVLSMYNGDLIPREQFDEHPDFDFYREVVAQSELKPLGINNMNTFIVQDGFEQNLNVGIKVKKHVDFFFEMIKVSHAKCKEWKDLPFSEMLVLLLTSLSIPKPATTAPKSKKQFTMTIHAIAGDLKLCQDILRSADKDRVISAEDQQAYLFSHICQGTIKLLKEVYLCIVVPEVNDAQEDPFKTAFKVILHVDTVGGRKKLSLLNEATYNNEIAISRKMSEKKIRLDLDITMKISSKDKGKTVDFDLNDNDPAVKKSPILSFGNIVAVNVAPTLKYYLKKTWEEATNVRDS